MQTLSFIASHSEQVTSPAPGTVNLAASDYCPYAMTLIGDNILTVQAHPEATRGVAARIYEFRRDRLGDTAVNAAIASLEKTTDEALFVEIARAFIARRIGRRDTAGCDLRRLPT